MDITEQIKREEENQGRVFLYVVGTVLKAYELSAYILSKCFPDVDLVEEVDRRKVNVVYATAVDANFTSGDDDFQILVSDDYVEMKYYARKVIEKMPEWINEFKNLKKKQQEADCFLGETVGKI